MSDFPYSKGNGDLSTLRVNPNPFPAQIRALELIGDGIGNQNYFVETIFNPWSVAEHLTSRQHLLELKASQPQKLMDIITRSEVNHARLAINEDNFSKLSFSDLRRQALETCQSAGKHFLLTPGCSVPNNTTVESVRRLETVYA